ncbi:DUF2304 domain-containing protein [Turicibacter sanguinis]|uniref:DUF2304 domain-containing protein n=1 Tax=Turicibacter sanguinis TaxID=154288 RepID=UPI0012BCFBB9|nr:DUF2304 family protein [Turicibacter sanguinis]
MERIISPELQVCLILGSVGTYLYIIYKIRKSNVRIDDMIIWIISSIILLIFSVIPSIPAKIANIVGFISAANLIFTSIIAFLLFIVFGLSVKLSQQYEKLKDLTHKVAILEKNIKEEIFK